VALARLWMPTPNYSSRGGTKVTTIVLHTAEGARTIQSLGSFFANPSSGVSSHVGIDDTPNTVGEYVRRDGNAWTAANANRWSVQAELCAFASWDSAEWNRHPNMLANCAAWIAEEAAIFGIPIVGLSSSQAQNSATPGVCQHIDLGSMGGGHVDCGPAFPFQTVLDMAKGGGSPLPDPDQEEPDVILIRNSAGEYSTFTGSHRLRVAGPADLAAIKSAGVKEPTSAVSDAFYNSIPQAK
jgi:hypothetical protein